MRNIISLLLPQIQFPFSKTDVEPMAAECLENKSLCIDHQYYYQLYVTGVNFVDFAVCTFQLNSNYLYERIEINHALMADYIKKATQFFKVAILPELLGRWFTRSLVILNSCELSEYNCCYCKEEYGGEMVCCDSGICQYGLYGFTCHALNYNLLLK